jgi:hypothetical protein
MNVHDAVLERLNYFNGQRLEAGDFRTEQAYHIAVRRALNRSLYSPGIASGLEVRRHPSDPHKVVVMPGLAIDALGRELILLEPREILARGSPAGAGGPVLGNYLVASYVEARAASAEDGCRPAGPLAARGCTCGGAGGGRGCSCGAGCGFNGGEGADAGLAWGGMTRIRADVLLDFANAWPAKSTGKIVLAQLKLDAQCRVADILTGMRPYTSGKQPPKVRALSLEGEKDIDHANPKILFFQVEGANPQAVTLHLWATKFSSLYYTELGRHRHEVRGTTHVDSHDFRHTHAVAGGHTDAAGRHTHDYYCDDATNKDLRVLRVTDPPSGPIVFSVSAHAGDAAGGFTSEPDIIAAPDHTHTLALEDALGVVAHQHALDVLSDHAGATGTAAHDGIPPLGFVDAMTIELDGVDITPLVLAYLDGLSPGDWAALGDGTATHALASSKGTGPIDLKQLGIEFALGAHKLVFAVPPGAGGQVHYNLYVE